MALTPFDILNGVFNVIFLTISFILGIIVLLKYFRNKNRNFIYIGLTIILLTSGWYGTTISFLVALVTGGDGLTFSQIVLLNFMPLPVGLIFWMIAFTNFLYQDKQKIVLGIIIAITAFFYVVFLASLAINPLIVGEKISPVDTKGNSVFLLSYIVIFILIVAISGIKFALETMKFDAPETKLKGKLLLIAFPMFSITGLLDSSFPSNELTLIIFRILLILSMFLFYGGFILPDWMRVIFLKDKNKREEYKEI
ncbi:MAG: hypothetical protein EU550_00095 [Promethearchaeota archaeon]|nr:MAG: hypothetical protein EU550_00095 [Candidatus Lokiarchaeota archaeon]